jgi:hypothetical protein
MPVPPSFFVMSCVRVFYAKAKVRATWTKLWTIAGIRGPSPKPRDVLSRILWC